MPEKVLTITEFARMGGKARAARYSKQTLAKWAAKGGRARARKYSPEELRAFAANAGRRAWKITPENERRILERLAAGVPHAEIASEFDLSLRAIGRLVSRHPELYRRKG
jgi:DNA-binding NarL/FixJ family response regulator